MAEASWAIVGSGHVRSRKTTAALMLMPTMVHLFMRDVEKIAYRAEWAGWDDWDVAEDNSLICRTCTGVKVAND